MPFFTLLLLFYKTASIKYRRRSTKYKKKKRKKRQRGVGFSPKVCSSKRGVCARIRRARLQGGGGFCAKETRAGVGRRIALRTNYYRQYTLMNVHCVRAVQSSALLQYSI